MPEIPRIHSLKSTLSLVRDPYRFISKTCRSCNSDIFQTRLFFSQTICLSGREAAEVFHNPVHFQRQGAAPGPIQKTLFGQGGVQGLDGEAHRHRKQMFLSLMTDERVAELVQITGKWWRRFAEEWIARKQVALYSQLQKVLCLAVCEWAGVALDDSEVDRRTSQVTKLFDYSGSIGPKYWLARRARKQADHWIADYIEGIRREQIHPLPSHASWAIAWHRDLQGELLDRHTAAVELLNVIRPVVAVSVYLVFVAHALHRFPESHEAVLSAREEDLEAFIQEVRRFYPFFPFVAARVREDFRWRGFPLHSGQRVLFDLYGTNHDERFWESPDTFYPKRFLQQELDRFGFVPQGGGRYEENHRCPGEGITIALMKWWARVLIRGIEYQIPAQTLELQWSRTPPVPESGFLIENIALRSKAGPASTPVNPRQTYELKDVSSLQ